MNSRNKQALSSAGIFFVIAILAVMAIFAGCTEQTSAPGPVTAQKTDPAHITVAFMGGPGTDSLVELEVTVTDSAGKTMTRSLGSRLGTTPVQINGSATFTGSYSGKAHVVATGYFSDGSHKVMLDTTV